MLRLHPGLAVVAILLGLVGAAAIEKVEVPAKALGKETTSAWVHLPKTLEKDVRYPALYLLHSFTGNALEWKQLGIEEAVEGLPLILVMVDGKQDFFGNFPKHPAWETHLLTGVIPHIDETHPTVASAPGRGLLGLSMGGHAALRLSLTFPETFSVGASVSGLIGSFADSVNSQVNDRVAQLTQTLPGRKAWNLYEVLSKTEASTARHSIFLECGSQDPWLEAHRAWVRRAGEQGIAYEYRESQGRHDYAFWRASLRELLPKASERLAKHQQMAARETAWEPLLGQWQSYAMIPGGKLTFETVFEIRKGQLAGRSMGQEGTQPFDRIAFNDGELSFRSYTKERTTDVRATMTEAGKLSGEWSVAAPTGEALASGEWQAEKSVRSAKEAAETKGDDEKEEE